MPQTPTSTPPEPPRPLGRADFPELFAARDPAGHKGTYGTLAIVGGAPGMAGAALLAGRAALRLGAGKVLIGLLDEALPWPCDPLQPELMLRTAEDLLTGAVPISAWTAGCGIGQSPAAEQILARLFAQRGDAPLVLDADALNLLAHGGLAHGGLAHRGLARGGRAPDWGAGPVVLTPHPAEAARLLGCETHEVQADRPAAAIALAARYPAWIVLKGAGTLICAPGGTTCRINPTGNPGLATAGTGDVLAGMLGALLAQRMPPEIAVPAAVWLHGAAADALAAAGIGPIGLTAGELADAARAIRNGR